MECGAYWPMVYGRILTAVAAPAKRLLPTLFANIAVKVVRSHNNGGGMRDAAAGVEASFYAAGAPCRTVNGRRGTIPDAILSGNGRRPNPRAFPGAGGGRRWT